MAPTDLPVYRDEKACLTPQVRPNPVTNPACCKTQRMSSTRKCCLGLLLVLSLTLGLATASVAGVSSNRAEGQAVVNGQDSGVSEDLSSASSDTLHKLLHAYFPSSFKHGVFESDEEAVEAIQSQLAKRQNDNSTSAGASTVTKVEGTTQMETVTQTAESSPTSKPECTPETTPESKAPETTTEAPPTTTKAPESTAKPTEPTTTTQQPSPTDNKPTTTAEPPPAETTTTKPADTTPLTTKTEDPPTTNQPAPTTTAQTTETAKTTETSNADKPDTTMATQTTERPRPVTTSRTSTFLSTLEGGAVTTITTMEVVTGEAAAAPTPTNDGSGGQLQTGNPAPCLGAPLYGAMAGAIAVGGVFLV